MSEARPVFDGDQPPGDTHDPHVPVDPSASDHRTPDTQRSSVAGDLSPRPDIFFELAADVHGDLEETRIRNENRLRSLQQFGLADQPEAARLVGLVDGLRALEHGAELELKRAVRKHPLGPWIKRTVGVGEKQGARLLAAIGDPASRETVSQLWAYCGYHVVHPDQAAVGTQTLVVGVAPSRRKGVKANWNATAKMRAFLVAESCMKQRRSPYRAVYDAGRAKYADAVHALPCARCGPKGKPAAIGSVLSDNHAHARALRLVAKAVLRDLWIEARKVAS